MENIKISNFRKIKESWGLNLAPITFFTGTNNSGKSTVIKSLLVLEDYLKSNNHFEIDFNGINSSKHKIDGYKSAINRDNFKDSKKDIAFEYQNKGFTISMIFEPSSRLERAQLKEMKLIREDTASLILERIGSQDYQLQIDARLLDKVGSSGQTDKLNTLALELTISNFIKWDQEELQEIQNRLEVSKKEIHLIELGDESSLEENTQESINKKLNEINNLIRVNKKKIIDLNQSISDNKKKLKKTSKLIKDKNKEETDNLVYSPVFSVNDFDFSNRRIDKIIRDVLPKYLVENTGKNRKKNNFKNSDESLELDRAYLLGDELISAMSFNVSHLSPHRSNQAKLFYHNNLDEDLSRLVKRYWNIKWPGFSRFMKKWMSKDCFDIGEDFEITDFESVASKIEVIEDGIPINLSDKGFGSGQIFSIILNITLSIYENQKWIDESRGSSKAKHYQSIILIEEPEANLHPALQSLLADLFLDAYKQYGIRFIIETHSEYLIRRSQVLVKEMNDTDSNLTNSFAAFYFEKDGSPYSMKYRKDGKFTNEFGSGFFDVSSNLAFDIL